MSGLTFYMHDGPATFRFELAGDLAGIEVSRLDQAWRTASSTFDGKALAVDVTFLTGADRNGRDLLFRWWRDGAHLIASSGESRKMVEGITGLPYVPSTVGPTFEPRFTRSAFRAAAAAVIVASMLLFPAKASAADDSGAVLERYSSAIAGKGLDTGLVQDGEPMAAITKSNYRFKFVTMNGASAVFQITPRKSGWE